MGSTFAALVYFFGQSKLLQMLDRNVISSYAWDTWTYKDTIPYTIAKVR